MLPMPLQPTFSSLLPQTIFWRSVWGTVLVSVAAGILAAAISQWMGRTIVHDLQNEASYTVLRNAVDLIGGSRIALEEYRGQALDELKNSLRRNIDFALRLLDSHPGPTSGEESRDATIRAVCERLQAMQRGTGQALLVIEAKGRIFVHADETLRGRSMDSVTDAIGDAVYVNLVEAAAKAKEREPVFVLYPFPGPAGGKKQYRLAAATFHAQWGLYVGAETSPGRIEENVAERERGILSEIRARLNEIILAKSGYIFVFDENCSIIAHPTLLGEEFASLKAPGSDKSLCELFKAIAEKPWGENKIRYLWDRPGNRGTFTLEKMAWCTVEPATGWYLGASISLSEIEANAPRLLKGLFLPALGAVLILGGALIVLLRMLLLPVQGLTRACQDAGQGNLSIAASEDAPGEIGFLCRHFNIMIKNIRELRGQEEERRLELEHLNRNLEKIVALRTMALERKARKLTAINVRLKEMDSLKSSFLSSVSHELRTPLTSIRGFAALIDRDLRRHVLPAFAENEALSRKTRRMAQNVAIISSEGERLTRLINDFLDLSKIESGKMLWLDSLVSFERILEQAVLAMSGLMSRKKNLTVRCRIQPGMPPLRADKDRLMQLCLNLLGNAAKFAAHGEITVRACSRDGWMQARITDSGRGIERKELQRIFETFHQVGAEDTLVEKTHGVGLGLAICRNIVSHYGGLIWAESEPSLGATIVFELPLAEDSPGEPSPEEPGAQ